MSQLATWRHAWRNLWRNRTRTIISVSAVSLTFALQLVGFGIGDHMYAGMYLAASRTAGGHVLVHGEGYWEQQASDVLIEDPDRVLAAIEGVPGVEVAIPRVLAQILVSSPRGNQGVRLQGVDPALEAALTDVGRYVAEGDGVWLDRAAPNPKRSPLVLGRPVVEDLGLELGDRVVVTATDPKGEMVRALFELSGILDTGSKMMDEVAAYTTIEGAREALGMGETLTQVGLILDTDEERTRVATALRVALPEAEVLTWDEAMPELVGFIEIDSQMNNLLNAVIFLVVLFGVANTFLMSVMERVRELGLLGALGMTPRSIASLVLCETTLLALLAIAIGFALGFAGHVAVDAQGIDISQLYQDGDVEIAGIAFEDMVLRSELRPLKWSIAGLIVFVLMQLSALYPALRATRVQPAEAMRTYA